MDLTLLPVSMSKIRQSDKEAIRDDREKWWNNFYSKVGLNQYFLNNLNLFSKYLNLFYFIFIFYFSISYFQYEKLSEVTDETVGIEDIDDPHMCVDREDDLGLVSK